MGAHSVTQPIGPSRTSLRHYFEPENARWNDLAWAHPLSHVQHDGNDSPVCQPAAYDSDKSGSQELAIGLVARRMLQGHRRLADVFYASVLEREWL